MLFAQKEHNKYLSFTSKSRTVAEETFRALAAAPLINLCTYVALDALVSR